MSYKKKTWVNVPDPNNYTGEIPLSDLPRFDAENMNRIEDGIAEHIQSIDKGGTGANTAKDAANNLMVKGIGGGIVIKDNEDLNSYTTVGNYVCSLTSTALSLSNCPSRGAFTMTVGYATGSSAYLYQEITHFSTGVKYYRTYTSSTSEWSEWRTTYSTSNKPTPSEIGASPSGHGLGETARAYNSDFIDMISKGGGFYTVANATDSPTGSTNWLSLMQLTKEFAEGGGGEGGIQIAADLLPANNSQGEAWIRTIFNGVPQDWEKILHSGNYADYANARITTGSYVGTGTSGENNKNSLTFPFEPKVIFMYCGADLNKRMTLVYGESIFYNNYTSMVWDGNTVYWWATGTSPSPTVQYNESGKTYHYVAIG